VLRAPLLAACLTTLAVLPATAGAAVLERSEPAAGGSLAPGEAVLLEFSAPVEIAADGVVLLDAAGNAMPAGPPEAVSDRAVRIPLEDAGAGLRILTWTGTAPGEEEPVRGSLVFDTGGATTDGLDVAGIARAAEASALALALLAAALAALVAAVIAGAVLRRRRDAGSSTIAAIGIGAAAAVAVGAALGILAVLGQPGSHPAFAAACGAAVGGALLGLAALRPGGAPRTAMVAAVLALAVSAIALTGAATAARPEPVAADAQKQVLLDGGGQVSLTIAPSAVGANTASVSLRDVDSVPDDRPVLVLRPLDGRIGPLRVPLRAAGDGGLVAERVLLPFAGRWRSQIEGVSGITADDPAVLDFDVIPNAEVQGGSGS
jgi:hypothetical protein